MTEWELPETASESTLGNSAKAAIKRTRKRAKDASSKRPIVSERRRDTKMEIVLKKLDSAKGITLGALVEATGWQPHSVRGFLSGTVKKKLGLPLVSEIGKDGVRRYRLDSKAKAD